MDAADPGAVRARRFRPPPDFELLEEAADHGLRAMRVIGELDLNHADELQAAIRQHARNHDAPLLVDLTACQFVDSTGLRALLVGSDELRNDGRDRLALVAPKEGQVRRVLGLTGLDSLMPTAFSEPEAVELLQGSESTSSIQG